MRNTQRTLLFLFKQPREMMCQVTDDHGWVFLCFFLKHIFSVHSYLSSRKGFLASFYEHCIKCGLTGQISIQQVCGVAGQKHHINVVVRRRAPHNTAVVLTSVISQISNYNKSQGALRLGLHFLNINLYVMYIHFEMHAENQRTMAKTKKMN